ncbi:MULTISPECIES: DUF4440 domain-containing protein [unclassified Microbacterium]|uniref:nuclear transport factor 2 family protein n=1 Tax=unclassified Microbacterium TaxID=2609290 RepID=UPI00214BDE00|nr:MULTISPECIES: DUF4440 domain-containing protein [unclassified Microbacterium]MCR2783645.1 DUF4440 domain-containing protein [Microbacterium sp. zg.B96]WIM15497.1 DUF4440 domain-containing protein [Microbacterium sp. zg-B96]
MWESAERFQAIKDAELALLAGDTRRDDAKVERLLHPDFAEIGRSGRRWTREQIVAALAAERDHVTPHPDEWLFNEIAPNVVVITYLLRTESGQSSRHSSIWDTATGTPTLRFHQGTVVPAGLD